MQNGRESSKLSEANRACKHEYGSLNCSSWSVPETICNLMLSQASLLIGYRKYRL